MITTRGTPLNDIQLIIESRSFRVPSGILLQHRARIPNGRKGNVEGLETWEISVPEGMDEALLKTLEFARFQSGRYSGGCIPVSLTLLKGTGPLRFS